MPPSLPQSSVDARHPSICGTKRNFVDYKSFCDEANTVLIPGAGG